MVEMKKKVEMRESMDGLDLTTHSLLPSLLLLRHTHTWQRNKSLSDCPLSFEIDVCVEYG